MHRYIFNIIDNSNLLKLENIEENIDDIKKDIEYLIQTIQNKILNL
jgi:hypothetical protein